MSGPNIAVIGAGFSGLLTAVHLLSRLPSACAWLIERSPRFGEGAAYATREADHVLNVRLGNMSAFPDDPEHLRRWLAGQPHWSAQGAFITRGDYGRYLRSILAEALAGHGPRLKLVHDEAVALHRESTGWRVGLASGGAITADVAVLALGNLEPARPAGLDGAVLESGRYIADPWRSATEVSDDMRRILLIGSSLTMVDVALSLARPGRRFTALSRRGLVPRAHAVGDLAVLSSVYAGSPVEVLRQARRAAVGSDWRSVTDDLRRSARSLWQSWTTAQKTRFLRHLRPIWDVHRHRLAPSVAGRMQGMLGSGELEIRSGRITRMEWVADEVLVTWRPRGASRTSRLTVDAVINCTGPMADVAASGLPLVKGLVDAGFARADPQGLGLDVDEDARVRDAEGTRQDELYAVGPMTRGAFWEVTSVPDIRIQAAEVADTIARHSEWA